MANKMDNILEFFMGAALLIVGTPAVLILVNTTGLSTIGTLIVGTLFPLVFAFGGLYLMWDALPHKGT